MITLTKRGRLGNNIFQNVVASIFSKKFDLKVENYINKHACKKIGCAFNQSGKIYKNDFVLVNDKNFLTILKEEKINYGLNFNGFFQNSEFVKNYNKEILSNFNLTYENCDKNDLFVHVRLGDLARCNVGLNYYATAIESIKYDRGFISSDDFNHNIVKNLINKYDLTPYISTPESTIEYAKNFNNLILSRSSFSWWIGFLSKAGVIIYPSVSASLNLDFNGAISEQLFYINESWKKITIK
ncbi:MAG: hypothetical protein RL728_128 [Bacteroidota bacterium]|jgi:hypothetical protein